MGEVTTTSGLLHGLVNLHITVYQGGSGILAPSVVGGLIGGVTALISALVVDYLKRRGDQARRWVDELANLYFQGQEVFIQPSEEPLSSTEIQLRSTAFITQLFRFISACGPPQRDWKKKRHGAEGILGRYTTELVKWKETGVPPNHEFVFGTEFDSMGVVRHWWRRLPKSIRE